MSTRIALSLALLVGVAQAQEPAPAAVVEASPRRSYPASRVERPLILPQLMVEPEVGIGVTNYESLGNGETLSFGLDVGVAKRLQLGFFFDFPIDPKADFGAFLFNVEVGVHRMINVRFDVGAERRSVSLGGLGGATKDAFLVGLGLPIKVKLHRMLAFVSGDASARGFGPQPFVASKDGRSSIYGYGAIVSNDLIALLVEDSSSSGMSSTALLGAMTLPVGLLIQPHDRISFGVRSGYRLEFAHIIGDGAASKTPLLHYVPLSLDVVVNPIRQLDIGFTAFLFGYVGAQNAGVGTEPGWADLRQFSFWVAGRI